MSRRIILIPEWLEDVADLSSVTRGELLGALCAYGLERDIPEIGEAAKIAFRFIVRNLERMQGYKNERTYTEKRRGAPKGSCNNPNGRKGKKEELSFGTNSITNSRTNSELINSDLVISKAEQIENQIDTKELIRTNSRTNSELIRTNSELIRTNSELIRNATTHYVTNSCSQKELIRPTYTDKDNKYISSIPNVIDDLSHSEVSESDELTTKSGERVSISKFVKFFNETMDGAGARIPRIRDTLRGNRLKLLKARCSEYGKEAVFEAVKHAAESDFLNGKTGKTGKTYGIDWMLLPNNFPKVLEGNYDNRNNTPTTNPYGTNNNNPQDKRRGTDIAHIRPEDYDATF